MAACLPLSVPEITNRRSFRRVASYTSAVLQVVWKTLQRFLKYSTVVNCSTAQHTVNCFWGCIVFTALFTELPWWEWPVIFFLVNVSLDYVAVLSVLIGMSSPNFYFLWMFSGFSCLLSFLFSGLFLLCLCLCIKRLFSKKPPLQ